MVIDFTEVMKSQKERGAQLAKEDIFKEHFNMEKKNLKNNCNGVAHNFHHQIMSNKSERISKKAKES